MANFSKRWVWGVVCAVLLGTVFSVQAIPVRIASYNVYFGVDTGSDRASFPADDDYAAVQASFERIQPDIVCFQELLNSDKQAWLEMAATLGFPYYAFSSVEGGTFAGDMRLGVWSKYPILSSDEIKETVVDPDAAEMTRWPLHAVIQVPGALNPFHVFSVHNKSGTTTKSERLRRSFEIYRTINYITNMIAQYPMDTEYAIMGDFNDTIEGAVGASQNLDFPITYYQERLDAGTLGSTYNDGFDIPWNSDTNWLMPYRYYPTDRLAVGGLNVVEAHHTGGTNKWTHDHGDGDGYRLDYILYSDEIMESAYGEPVAEVLFSPSDGVGVGLTKYGSPLSSLISSNASDHRMVFSDFYLIDVVAGVTPVGILSEVVDHLSTTNGNYVELCNTGSSELDLTGYSLAMYLSGSTNPTVLSLSGTMAAGGVHLVAASTNEFLSTWGVPAQWQAPVIGLLDGDDTVALRKSDGETSDIYGEIGSVAGAWDFTDSTAVRKTGVSDPLSTWDAAEWTITAGNIPATPGTHQALSNAEAYVSSGPGLDPAAPRATNQFAITVGITPNVLASNLAATGVFRIAGGSWIDAAMTNSSGTDWQSAMINVAKDEGDVLEYSVCYAFQGPGGIHTNFSETNSYIFPVVGAASSIKPLFNEVQADGAGADSNEFIEIIAPIGISMEGYKIEHRNGSDTTDGPVWTFTFPAFFVPDDGVLDTGGNSLGFAVISQDSNTVANTDFLLPGGLLNSGDGLILYDTNGVILDAVVWLGDTYDIGADDPSTVSESVPPGSANYLHTIGTDSSTDNCPQAPNNILMSTNTWVSALATPGALNAPQTSGSLIVVPGDQDSDGLLDDVDNCPDIANATQIDTDSDGLGDACDSDLDGDGIFNIGDNCEYTPNADQSDIDGDGIGDLCDPDADGDGIPNDEDPNPYYTGNLDIDFEDSNLHGTLTDYTPIEIADRWWVFTNSLVVSDADANDRIEGLRGARLRGPGSMNLIGALTNGIGDCEFAYARYKTDKGVEITPQYNAGDGWVDIASVNSVGLLSLTTNSTTVDVVGPVDFRIIWTAGGTRDDANLDNIWLTSFAASGEADCLLDAAVSAAFDGSAHPASFTTVPAGIPHSVNWSPAEPIEIGTYHASVVVSNTESIIGGTFVFSNAVSITQGVATCSLDVPGAATYDGLAHTNSFTVTTGLSWSVDYSPETPVEPGAYDATVTVTGDSHYTGDTFVFSNAMVIDRAQATCTLDASITVPYDGAIHTNTFTITTGLTWSASYAPTLPQGIGVYDVTVSVLGDSQYIGVTNAYPSSVTIQSTNPVVFTVGAPYTIDFESPYIPDYNAYGPHTNILSASTPDSWFLDNATRGNLSNDVKTAAYSLRLRYIGAAATSNGVIQSTESFPGIHSVAFNYAMYNGDAAGTLSLQTSANGTDWTVATNIVADGIQTNFASFSNLLELTEAAYLRIQVVDGVPLDLVNIDDIVILPYEALPATVTLSNLTHVYDGLAKSPTATTDPTGLSVEMTYDGLSGAPTNAGSYEVIASVSTPGYAGSATGTLVVARAIDSISFSNTNQAYSGSAISVTATATSGSPVSLTYDGSASAPVDVGVYAVTGIVDEVNWTATNTTTLTITASDVAPSFDPLGVQTAYVASAMSFSVSAAGYPTPVLALQGTTASSGYSFTPATGQLDYTPPVGDVGTMTFTFTASNTVGVATQAVDVTVISGVPDAPAAIWASETNVTDFTAAWSSAAGATEYRLDVGTNATFGGTEGGSAPVSVLSPGDIAIIGANYDNPDQFAFVALVDIEVGASISFTECGWTNDQFRTGEGTILWSNSAPNVIAAGTMVTITPTTTASTGTVSSVSGTWALSASGDQILAYQGDFASPTFIYAVNSEATGWQASAIDTVSSGLPPGLTNGVTAMAIDEVDNFVYGMSVTTGTQSELLAAIGDQTNWSGSNTTRETLPPAGSFTLSGGGTFEASYVAGYSNRTVSGTSESVTGLSSGVEYFFRVLAVSPGGTSVYSSVASVITKAPQTITFPAIADQLTTNTLGLSATATSGLLPGFSVASGPAIIAGGTNLSFSGAGAVSIVAFQPGNTTYAAAPDVTNTFQVTAVTASVTLGDLAQTNDGTARIVTATTVPPGLSVSMTYDGSGTAPTNAGSYTVIGTISDAMYQGAATNTLVVESSADPFEGWVTDQGQDPANPDYAQDEDIDLDGMTTYEEYLADTDPALAGSVLELTSTYAIVSVSNGTGKIRLSFPASTGRYYQIEYSTNLFNGTIISNLGWGVPGMVITNDSLGMWYGAIRSRLTAP